MMVYEKRTFNDFSRSQCAEIATQYAQTHLGKSEAFFTEKYNISSGTFYTILHNAISKCMVSDKIAEKIRYKACSNSRAVAGKTASMRSFDTYRRLLEKRTTFKFRKGEAIKYAEAFANSESSLYAFCQTHAITEKLLVETLQRVIDEKLVSKETIEQILDKQAAHYTNAFAKSGVSLNAFCKDHPISKQQLTDFLKRGIITNLVSDAVVVKMRDNALKRHDSDRVYTFFGSLEEERKSYING